MARVFYSWQSDRHSDTGRDLVRHALQDAINRLNSDTDIEDALREDVVLDSDTHGEPGSPPIVQTIFAKIDAADVFVADLTFVNQRVDGRPTPNPNVLIEYGWALKALSHSRIVAVMNACFGDPSDKTLPFDLGHLRHPITYDCADDASDAVRREQRAKLAARLSEALKLILALGKTAIAQDAEFVPKSAEGGPGRFRNPVQPIGHLHGGEGVTTGQINPQRVWLPHGASMWLRVMPRNPLPESLLSPRIEAALRTDSRLVEPLNFYHSNIRLQPVRDRDGFGVCGFLGREEMPAAVVHVFLSGEIWSIDTARLASEISYICFDENAFSAALVAFSAVLGRLDIAAPYRWIAGMEGVRGRSLRIPGQGLGPMPPASQAASNVIEVQGTFSGIDADAKHSLEPFFRQVFGNHHLIRPMPLTGTQNSAPR